MKAMVFDGTGPLLKALDLPDPEPGAGEILLNVHACGVCRTDLNVVDGELAHPKHPVISGREIVGTVAALGAGVTGFAIGDRVGAPWLGSTCCLCPYCIAGRENLCDAPGFTGYTLDGGYAQRTVAKSAYCLHLPQRYDDAHAAPLLCAGLIGYRTLVMAGDARTIGIYGFGAAAHIIAQVAAHPGAERLCIHASGRHRRAAARVAS
jgi:alcohol dehydrogenase, propanol-preferring